MAQFGQYLIRQGLISAEQLDEALQHQALYGARLGTNLVDLAMISMSELAQELSTFHKAPLPPREWVTKPHRDAVKACNRGLVERLRFVPMRVQGKVLHAAVLDPNDPGTLDDLRFATGCRVKAYVLPELAMHDLLARLWKIPRGVRPIDVEDAQERLEEQRAQAKPDNPLQDPREIDLDSWEHNPPVQPPMPPPMQAAAGAAARSGGAGGVGVTAGARRRRRARVGPAAVGAGAEAAGPPSGAPVPAISGVPVPMPSGPDVAATDPTGASALDAAKQLAALMRGAPRRERNTLPEPPAAAPARMPDVQITSSLASPQMGATTQDSMPQVPEPHAIDLQSPVTSDMGLGNLPEPGLPPVSNLATQLASIVPDPMPDEDALPEAPREPTPVPEAMPEPKAFEIGALETRLLEAATRDDLIAAAMDIGCLFGRRVALFVVNQGTIQGARCRIEGREHAIDGVLFPADAQSMLAGVAANGVAARVNPGEQAFDKRLLSMLGEGTPPDAGVFAVSIKSRVVNLLYVDHADAALPHTVHAAIGALAELMAQGYEALILRRKTG